MEYCTVSEIALLVRSLNVSHTNYIDINSLITIAEAKSFRKARITLLARVNLRDPKIETQGLLCSPLPHGDINNHHRTFVFLYCSTVVIGYITVCMSIQYLAARWTMRLFVSVNVVS